MTDLVNQIKENVAKLQAPIRLMEVCGTHTAAIHRCGFPTLFKGEFEFLSGPGCPVCVTTPSYIDQLADLSNSIAVYTFGDMLRVPGNRTSLAESRAAGAKVNMMISPLEAVRRAAESSEPAIIAAVGFDTTAPAFALAVDYCVNNQIKNVYFLTELKTIEAPLKYLLNSAPAIDALVLPGNVAAVIGEQGFKFIENYRLPAVITGFSGTDILQALFILTASLLKNDTVIHNQYRRIVRAEGNQKAQKLINHYYEPCTSYFRGIGALAFSGLALRPEYAYLEYPVAYDVEQTGQALTSACQCGNVLMGRIKPPECPLFAVACRPDHPQGACMVSTEGSCAAYFRYGGGLP